MSQYDQQFQVCGVGKKRGVLGRPDLEDSVLEAFQTPEMRVAKFRRFKTCQRRFCDRAKLTEGKQEEPSKEMAIAHFKSWLLPTQAQCLQRIAILACFRRFSWVWNCDRAVTCTGTMFSENSKPFVCFSRFCWALNCGIVVACTGAVFYENLDLP